MNERDGIAGFSTGRGNLERVLERVRGYLATRTADHWIMFLAGLVIGLIVG